MSIEVHPSSVESLFAPILSVHPSSGPVDLSGLGVEVALPVSGVAPSTWVSSTWASGTWRRGDDRYYLATIVLSSFSLSAGSSYQAWVRIGGASGAIVKSGIIKAANT